MPWLAAALMVSAALLIIHHRRRGRGRGRRRHAAGIEPGHAKHVPMGEGPEPQEVPRETVVAAGSSVRPWQLHAESGANGSGSACQVVGVVASGSNSF